MNTRAEPAGIDPDLIGAAGEAAIALTGWISGPPPPPPSLDESAAEALVRLCEDHRLLGALGEAVRLGGWALPDGAHAWLSSNLLRWQTNSLLLESLAIDVCDALDAAGIEHRLLKGVATAHSLYESHGSRVFADLDVLVRGADLDRAVDVLGDAVGGRRLLPDVRPGFTAEFGKDVTLRARDREIDVHRTLAAGPFGLTIPLDELFHDVDYITFGGRQLPILSGRDVLLHACYSAALGDLPVRLGSVRDLMAAATVHGDRVEDAALAAERWQGTAVLVRAAQLATHLLDLGDDHPVRKLAALPVPGRERRRLGSYLVAGRSYRRQLAALRVVPGTRARVRYSSALLWPSAEYLSARGWSRRGHVARASIRLTKRRPV